MIAAMLDDTLGLAVFALSGGDSATFTSSAASRRARTDLRGVEVEDRKSVV